MSPSNNLPPQAPEAEESLIGAALIRPQIVGQLAGTVDPSDFWRPFYSHVWQAMLDLHAEGQPIDIVTVGAKLGPLNEHVVLAEAQNATPAVSNAGRYADAVIEASRRRRLIRHYATLAEMAYEQSADEVLAQDDPQADRLIASRAQGHVQGLAELSVFLAEARSPKHAGEWLIPHVMRSNWRIILVAGEGVGKATLMRFLGMHAAAGRDPWASSRFITPRRVLYIDAENSPTTIEHQTVLANTGVDLEAECEGRFHVWHRPAGINFRDRRACAEMEEVLQQTRPEIVLAGPLYKMFRRKPSEDMEMATVEFLEILDDFRVRFNFGLMLEAHAPKGVNGGYRELNPRGSAVLMGWPEFGITLEPVGNPMPNELYMRADVGRFRPDREPADWPDSIERGKIGQRAAWSGTWVNGRNKRGFPTDPASA